jgi:hypothetical protein
LNALAIIREVAGEIGIPVPTIALASTDPQIVQLVKLLNKEGRALSARYGWERLTREATFTTLAAESQGTVASIVGVAHSARHIVNDTIWNRTRQWPVCGPQDNQNWQGYKAMSVTGPVSQYRIRGGELLFMPTPAAGETCAFEYVDKYWCTDVTGVTFKGAVTVDSDAMLLDDEIMQQGLLWRWRAAKKLDYTEDFVTYENMVADAMARDGTKPTLSMAGDPNAYQPVVVTPVGSWSLP